MTNSDLEPIQENVPLLPKRWAKLPMIPTETLPNHIRQTSVCLQPITRMSAIKQTGDKRNETEDLPAGSVQIPRCTLCNRYERCGNKITRRKTLWNRRTECRRNTGGEVLLETESSGASHNTCVAIGRLKPMARMPR